MKDQPTTPVQVTCTVILVVMGTPAEALAAAEARGLLPLAERIGDMGAGPCRVESPLQESALVYATQWFWETYYPPHAVGALIAIDADVRRPMTPEARKAEGWEE